MEIDRLREGARGRNLLWVCGSLASFGPPKAPDGRMAGIKQGKEEAVCPMEK